MKFEGEDADDRLIAVATCTDADDVLLATRKTVRKTASEPDKSKAIRFSANEVRVFSGRSSVGVRGIQVDPDDRVISMSILRHEEIAPDLRNAYLSLAAKRRRQMGEESELAAGQRLEPEDGAACRVGAVEGTVLVRSPDYDGKGKLLVRLADGAERIVGASRVDVV